MPTDDHHRNDPGPASVSTTNTSRLVLFASSSNVRSATLDDTTGVVEVEFSSGDRYRFANFTTAQLADWEKAKSPGGWFDLNIKKRPKDHPVIEKKPADSVAAAAESRRSSTTAPLPAPSQPPAAPAPRVEHVDHETCTGDVKEAAKQLYEAYCNNSGWFSWDGKQCPVWKDLSEPVRSHWCAVVLEVKRGLQSAGLTHEHQRKLTTEIAHLKRRVSEAEGAANHKLQSAVLERTQTEASETEKLRARVAELEEKLRSGESRPWRKNPPVV